MGSAQAFESLKEHHKDSELNPYVDDHVTKLIKFVFRNMHASDCIIFQEM